MDLLALILMLETREDETYTVAVPVFLTPMHLNRDGFKPVVVPGDKMKMSKDWETRFKIFNAVIQAYKFHTLGGNNVMKRDCRVLLILATIVILWKIALGYSNPIIEKQVGPFRLSDPTFTEAKLVSEFGEGYVQVQKVGDIIMSKKLVFWVPEQGVWVQAGFSHVLDEKMERIAETVLVTKKKLCNEDKRYIPVKKLTLLATSKGIKINDSIHKVIEKYGEPSVSKAIGKDKVFTVLDEELKLKQGEVFRYLQEHPSRELNFAEFYFDKKKLHSFLISESE